MIAEVELSFMSVIIPSFLEFQEQSEDMLGARNIRMNRN